MLNFSCGEWLNPMPQAPLYWLPRPKPISRKASTGLNSPKGHQTRVRTTDMGERMNQEIKRRTRVIRILPNVDSLLRVIIARMIKLSDDWETGEVYLTMHPKSQLLSA